MAGNNASEIRVAGTGRILVAEIDAPLPDAFSDNPAADWGRPGPTSATPPPRA